MFCFINTNCQPHFLCSLSWNINKEKQQGSKFCQYLLTDSHFNVMAEACLVIQSG
jgi:hypothetical protein